MSASFFLNFKIYCINNVCILHRLRMLKKVDFIENFFFKKRESESIIFVVTKR